MLNHKFRALTTLTVAMLVVGCVKPTTAPAPGARTATATTSPSKPTPRIGTDAKAKATAGLNAKVGTADVQTLSHARSGAARALNIISLMGDASLKAANQAKGRPAVASASLTQGKVTRYTLSQASGSAQAGDTVVVDQNASGTSVVTSGNTNVAIVEKPDGEQVITQDGKVTADVKVSGQQTQQKDDGKVETSETLTVKADENNATGTEAIKVLKDANGKVVSTQIAFNADANAQANGEGDANITFTPNNEDGSDNNLDIKLAIDPKGSGDDNEAEAVVEERQDDNGDITTEGDLSLPGDKPACDTGASGAASVATDASAASGAASIQVCPPAKSVHITIVIHADGTKDITCVGADYSFAVSGVSKDGVGHGTLFQASDISEAGIKIGEIQLNKGDAQDEIRFYQPDGTLGETVKFKFTA